MKAYIVRKAANVEEWEAGKAYIKSNFGAKAKHDVVIEKTITLTPFEFARFCDNLLEDWNFITENRELMRVDENEIWHCLKVTAKGSKISVLVESEGYDYARYTSIIKN